jgi:hypothetical protein
LSVCLLSSIKGESIRAGESPALYFSSLIRLQIQLRQNFFMDCEI